MDGQDFVEFIIVETLRWERLFRWLKAILFKFTSPFYLQVVEGKRVRWIRGIFFRAIIKALWTTNIPV